MQSVIERRYEALNKGDLRLFESTVDQTNKYWKAVQEQQYLLWFESYGGSKARGTLRGLDPAPGGLYRGNILLELKLESGEQGQALQSWVFRKVGDKWKITEPTARELGKLRTWKGEGVVLEYYDWDRWQAWRVLKLADESLKRVSRVLGVKPTRKVQVRLLPAYEVSPGAAAGHSVGYYRTITPNLLYLRSPGSYGFGGHDPSEPPYTELKSTATHELTHLLGDRRVSLADLPDWMIEGLAEWVSDGDREYEVMAALEDDRLWDLTLLEDFSLLSRDVGLAYGQSYELVDFLVDSYGIGAYWKLAEAYAKGGRLESGLRSAVGMGVNSFERRWLAWLRNKYGLTKDG